MPTLEPSNVLVCVCLMRRVLTLTGGPLTRRQSLTPTHTHRKWHPHGGRHLEKERPLLLFALSLLRVGLDLSVLCFLFDVPGPSPTHPRRKGREGKRGDVVVGAMTMQQLTVWGTSLTAYFLHYFAVNKARPNVSTHPSVMRQEVNQQHRDFSAHPLDRPGQ